MAPEPPRVGDEYLPSVSSDFLTMTATNSDDSDTNTDSAVNDLMLGQGYTLFVGDVNDSFYQNDTSIFDDDDDSEPDDTDSDVGDLLSQNIQHTDLEAGIQIRPQLNNEQVGNPELCSTSNCDSGETDCGRISVRSDIKVDCDQIKAAMIGFTLPPSAIPQWAINISDEDIASHINRLLLSINNSNKK